MTIETVIAPDNNVPIYKNGGPSKVKKIVTSKKFMIGAAVISVLFLLVGGGFGELMGFYFMFIMAYLTYSIIGSHLKIFKLYKNKDMVPTYYKDNHEYFKKHLISRGFQVDYESIGILVDATNKKIAFTIDPELRPQITVCDFTDVQRWQYYNNNVEWQNGYGATQSILQKYFVSVYIRDPEHPRYDFFTKNDVDADQWVARFNALLN